MALEIQDGDLPAELKNEVLSERCVAFLGSGPSAPFYGSWRKVVRDVSLACGVDALIAEDTPAPQLLDAAQAAKNANCVAYYEFFGKHFGQPVERTTLLYDALLACPFCCYLTVNFDGLLSRHAANAKRPCHPDVRAYPSLDPELSARRSINYLHGFIEENETPVDGQLVFAADEFERAYAPDSNLTSFLLHVLGKYPVVFVGCRLHEPPMARVFRLCEQRHSERRELDRRRGREVNGPPPRFLLLSEPERDPSAATRMQAEEEYYRRLNIQVVWYKADREDHSVLRQAFDKLANLPVRKINHTWSREQNVLEEHVL